MKEIRSLPRAFVVIEDAQNVSNFDIPDAEFKKIHNVLRLRTGDKLAFLPNDGTLLVCELEGRRAKVLDRLPLDTDAKMRLTLAVAYLKSDGLDEVIRMGAELGVAEFILFPTDRTVVKWEGPKLQDRLRRWNAIAQEACEVALRSRLPVIRVEKGLAAVLEDPAAYVLSEANGLPRDLSAISNLDTLTLVSGPEGGWSPREFQLIGDRGISMGPRILRATTAPVGAAAALLCR
jgi:16S rRNA (uracil1498-N3)-methyltransferase